METIRSPSGWQQVEMSQDLFRPYEDLFDSIIIADVEGGGISLPNQKCWVHF